MFIRVATSDGAPLVSTRASRHIASSFTYEAYCAMLDGIGDGRTASQTIEAGVFDKLKSLGVSQELLKMFASFKEAVQSLISDFNLGILEIVVALKCRDVWALLRAIGFNLMNVLKAVRMAFAALHNGLLAIFKLIEKSPLMEAVRKGLEPVDALLDKFPALKLLTGPVIAGIIVFGMLHQAKIGDALGEFDMSMAVDALTGKVKLSEFLTSSEFMLIASLFATGSITTVAFHWVEEGIPEVLACLVCTGANIIGRKDIAKKLLAKMPLAKTTSTVAADSLLPPPQVLPPRYQDRTMRTLDDPDLDGDDPDLDD